MPQHYAEAERMLGVTDNKIFGPADHMLKKWAMQLGLDIRLSPLVLQRFFHPKVKKVARPTLTRTLTVKVQTAELVRHVAAV